VPTLVSGENVPKIEETIRQHSVQGQKVNADDLQVDRVEWSLHVPYRKAVPKSRCVSACRVK